MLYNKSFIGCGTISIERLHKSSILIKTYVIRESLFIGDFFLKLVTYGDKRNDKEEAQSAIASVEYT